MTDTYSYGMKDSGKRDRFPTGAVRDAGPSKPHLELLSPFALRRLGHWSRLGAEKYSPRNWEKGIPISRFVRSAFSHLLAIMAGDDDEDHEAALMWNAQGIIHTRELIRRGILPASLDDLPDYDCAPRSTLEELADRFNEAIEECHAERLSILDPDDPIYKPIPVEPRTEYCTPWYYSHDDPPVWVMCPNCGAFYRRDLYPLVCPFCTSKPTRASAIIPLHPGKDRADDEG